MPEIRTQFSSLRMAAIYLSMLSPPFTTSLASLMIPVGMLRLTTMYVSSKAVGHATPGQKGLKKQTVGMHQRAVNRVEAHGSRETR
jgi:hypothetical protein